jgi:hypothetical protein
MCRGVDSTSENEYQVNPGSKGCRCVRLTTYNLHVPMSRILGALTSWNPVGLFRPVMGQHYLPVPCISYYFVLWPTNAHNNFTNYHITTCFDTIVSSSDSLQSIPCQVTPVFQMQLSVIQFTIKMFHTCFMPVLILQSLKSQYYKIFKTLKLSYLQ